MPTMTEILGFSPIMPYIILIIGFFLLIKGADYFVDGCSSVAKKFHIPTIIIGLTIAAFGTSAPEAAVSITSSMKEANDMSVSNVIGSNMFNLLMVIGLCSIIKPLKVSNAIIKRDFPICIIVTAIILLMAADCFIHGISASVISRFDGIFLLAIFTCYIFLLIYNTLNARKKHSAGTHDDGDNEIKTMATGKSILCIIAGVTAVLAGGEFVVDSASDIAYSFGLSGTFVGLTIVAIGTSLPELVTSIIASFKGENDLALGNVVGSNLFNILFVLGIAATVSPIHLSDITDSEFILYDIIVLTCITVLAYVFSLIKKKITKTEGAIMVFIYVCYMIYIVIR